jgi:hypothetical protein
MYIARGATLFSNNNIIYSYIHSNPVDYFFQAVTEKILRDRNNDDDGNI